ncbi:MAG: ADP-ribosylation factor-like protein [Candidatus Hodarchaeales archaeon]|jgi:small GTP-binding protein
MSHLKTTVRAIGTPLKLVFCGLDYAGKTAMYIRLKTGKFVADLKPTLSSTMDSITIEEDDELVKATIIDLGGQESLRDLWGSHLEQSHVIIFVKNEFHKRVLPMARRTPCIIVCNKFDLIKADSVSSSSSKLIHEVECTINAALEVPKDDNFAILVASQKTGYGLPKMTRLIRELVI